MAVLEADMVVVVVMFSVLLSLVELLLCLLFAWT
jgi:hypothetical protein